MSFDEPNAKRDVMTRTLPAGACISHAINSVRNNIAYAFRISWPWYLVIILLGLGAGMLAERASGGNPEANPGSTLPIYLGLGLFNLLAFASIAVNWHRYILLDEVPAGSGLFRLDDKTWRYFGNVLLISLILIAVSTLVVLPLVFLGSLMNASVLLGFLAVAAAFCLIGPLFFRLSIKLPAIALGRRDFSLSHALAATRGNGLPLFLVFLFEIAAALGMILVLLLLVFIAGAVSEMLAFALGTVLQILVNWIFTIFGITVLTSLYGFFVEGRDF